jgi:hypothetical protein
MPKLKKLKPGHEEKTNIGVMTGFGLGYLLMNEDICEVLYK